MARDLDAGLAIGLGRHFDLDPVEHPAELGVRPAGLLVDLGCGDATGVHVDRVLFVVELLQLLLDAVEGLFRSRPRLRR